MSNFRSMRPDLFRPNDRVLLSGEGNFSFTVALRKLVPFIRITATCYETSVIYKETSTNIADLTSNGWYPTVRTVFGFGRKTKPIDFAGLRVILGVDATKLKEHSILSSEKFDKILFNFPHVGGKMKINLNRELLRKFFIAAKTTLDIGGEVFVTLCNGQGGTAADDPRRRRDDSWQIVEMAAHGDFSLRVVEPFVFENFPDYKCIGYRSLDKGFNVKRALVHIFRKSDPPDIINIQSPHKITDWSKIGIISSWNELKFAMGSNNEGIDSAPNFKFDLTFSVTTSDFNDADLYAILYNFAARVIINVKFLRSYEFPDSHRVTRSYRISYGSIEFPLYRNRVIELHKTLITKILEDNLNVIVTK